MIIYKATNTNNGKCYIGQTINSLKQRVIGHKHGSSSKGYTYHFYNAIRKYGWDNFIWEVIDDTCQTKDELDEMEFHYIKQYNSLDDGYNLTEGGDINPMSNPDTRKKASITKTGTTRSVESRKKQSNTMQGEGNHFYGKSHSDESRRKISENTQGRVPWNKGNTTGIRSNHAKTWVIQMKVFNNCYNAASFFGVSRGTIRRWCNKNEPFCYCIK